MEAKRPLKAQLTAELASAADSDAQEQIRAAFSAREKAIEHDIDHKPMDVHMCLDVSYNVSIARRKIRLFCVLQTSSHDCCCFCLAVPVEVNLLGTLLEGRLGWAQKSEN